MEWNRRIELNVEYVENMSLWLDLEDLVADPMERCDDERQHQC